MAKNSGKAADRRPDGMPVGTPFRKGTSGNSKGRKPGSVSIKAELQKLLDMTLKGEVNPLTAKAEDNMPVGRKIAIKLVTKAATDGDVWAAFRIMEHLDGKPAQDVNLGGQDDNPIQTTFTLKIDNS
jgi:hypothetical protein